MSDPTATPEPEGPPPIPGVEIFEEAAETAETPTGVAHPSLEPSEPRLAHPVARAGAFAIDGLGTFLVTTVVVFTGLSNSFDGFGAILWVPVLSAVLCTVLTAIWGVTPAKALVGIRVVDARTGRPIGWRSILRSLVIVAPVVLIIGMTWAMNQLPYQASGWFFNSAWPLLTPIVGWIVLLVVLSVSPRHRGLQDLAGGSIVVRRESRITVR
jgi:uncharacterized RDD family membrane protein YckC